MTQQLERRYANDFFKFELPERHWQPRVWLGPLPPGKEAREYMVTGKWADAIVFDPKGVTIIEFKLEPASKAIGQLEMYAQEFPKTLRFRQYWGQPMFKMLVTTRVDEALKEQADKHSIEYKVFRPDWVEYWEKRRFRL